MTKVKTIELQPVREVPSDYDAIEVEIKRRFREEIYNPILRELGAQKFENARDDLLRALQAGRVQFHRGVFSMKGNRFSADISRELKNLGATFDRSTSTWRLLSAPLPLDVRNAISASKVRFQEKIAKIDERLAQISPAEFAGKIKLSKHFDTALWKTEKKFRDTVKNIIVAPKLTKEQAKIISDDYETNLQLDIKTFTEKEILELRQKIKKSVFAGNRYESAVRTIEKSYGVTERKAKFLARQETSLLMTKYKQTRYEDAGVNEYKWGCVHRAHDQNPKKHTPGNVRYSHGLLENKIFAWNNPPITSNPGEPARRNNPGQDYNCRCFARPIVRVRGESTKK